MSDGASQSRDERRDPARQSRRRNGRRLTDLVEPDEQHLTIEEVAARLRVDARTVRKWIHDLPPNKRLRAYEFEGRRTIIRIAVADLKDFRERNRLHPKDHAPPPPLTASDPADEPSP